MFKAERTESGDWHVFCCDSFDVVAFYTLNAEVEAREYAAYRNAQEAARQVMEGYHPNKIPHQEAPSSPPKKYAVIESMTRIESLGLGARIWRDQDEVSNAYFDKDLFDAFEKALTGDLPQNLQVRKVAEALAALPKVNAVEVTYCGQGIVLYNNW